MGLPAPCGYEEKVALVMRDLLADYTGQAEIDRAGNVMATLPGQDHKAPSLMIFAHMDQLGFMVRKIEPDGLIQLDRMGGTHSPRSWPTSRTARPKPCSIDRMRPFV